MPRETEIKFVNADHDSLRARIQALGGKGQAKRFERNLVLDTPDRRLRDASILLRLRQDGRALLTLKKPPDGAVQSGGEEPRGKVRMKVWEELETEVADFEAMLAVLRGLGYVTAFAYEKYREVWRLDQVIICLDTLPFGDYVELEGEREHILALVEKLDMDLDDSTPATYHELNRDFRRANGLEPNESFVFEEHHQDSSQGRGNR